MEATTGNFTSVNYPSSYPHGRECVWIISVQPGNRVRLTINDFDVENHPTCDYDAFEVYIISQSGFHCLLTVSEA